ncbi:hypothetical protein Tco_0843304 [Tanacetum coccineum]|uniref:Reverse transcriptase domain-containing protein n=1 Tax=Tanacetum coccineum TaxID=301880 RepID=A0ABQ5B4J2_9ASTR
MSELPPCVAITPALYTDEPVDSLIIEDEHLDTIPETESDEFIKSSVENLVQDPSESEGECECDVPDCNDSQTTIFSTFSNPLFDDSSSSDDESSYEEDVHEMSFKTYSNPLFDLDKEIISIELNPIHNEDLDSTPKDVRFDAESYLLESLVNRDTLNVSPPKIDHLFDEFADELTRLKLIPPGIDIINLIPRGGGGVISCFLRLCFTITLLPDHRKPFKLILIRSSILLPQFLSPLRIVTLLGKRSIYFSFESFHVDYPNPEIQPLIVWEDSTGCA